MDRPPLTRSSGRAALWTSYALMLYTAVALAGVLIVANLILYDHNVRFDLTPNKRFTLSDFDKKVLTNLKSPIKVMAFVRTEDPSYIELEELLFRVAAFTPMVTYQVVDVNKAPGLARQYGVSSYGEVVVESGGRRRDFDNSRPEGLVPALLQISHDSNKKIYFTTNHGERDLFDNDRSGGFTQWRNLLLQNNYQVENVSLFAGGVPDDASVVVILSPQKDFQSDELAALQKYLAGSGKLLVMLDPFASPSLVQFLKQYHIDFLDQVVVDPAYRLSSGEILTTQIPLRAGDNEISRPVNAPAVFSGARGIVLTGGDGANAPDGLQVQRESLFLRSSHESWASGDPRTLTTGITEFQEGRDLKGPITVGAEIDLSPQAKAHIPLINMTRIVAFGDVDFAANQFFEMQGNRDLVMNAVNELANDRILIASRERVNQAAGAAFYISDEQSRWALRLGGIIEPLILFTIGIAVFVRRRFFV